MEKCDARYGADCDAKGQYLWLRNNIFYCRFELPRQGNKRRYKRVSLHTDNFFEAREIIKVMINDNKEIFAKIRTLMSELDYELDLSNLGLNGNYGMLSQAQIRRRLSKRNNPEKIKDLLTCGNTVEKVSTTALNQKDRELIKEFVSIRPLLEDFLRNQAIPTPKTTAQTRTIGEILDKMLLKSNNCKSEQTRKRNAIIEYLAKIGLKPEDDYAKFHNVDAIDAIGKLIVEQTGVMGDKMRRDLRYIKELAKCGHNTDPDVYKSSVTLNLPNIPKTKKSERKPHIPYSQEQLLEIFNPKHDYFKNHPDAFYACLIALYTGARANSAVTLQYNDIIEKEGLACINFTENHPIKQFKNDASERVVPIHPQLIELGFVAYVRNRQKKLNAQGTDFIFPKCQTKGGLYNNKYVMRKILSFFTEIGVKSGTKDGYDFHSFRKNASIALQDARIPQTYINDIIGWEGKNTMEQSYSNHTLQQIYAELIKFNYDFLKPTFDQWKEIVKTW